MKNEDLVFEKALEKLDKIVQDLESGEISLEQALAKYEEGVRLSRACQQKLTEAETKVELLTRTLSGELERKPFATDQGESQEPRKRSKRQRLQTEGSDSEDVLI